LELLRWRFEAEAEDESLRDLLVLSSRVLVLVLVLVLRLA
jgi:hypothetical protein